MLSVVGAVTVAVDPSHAAAAAANAVRQRRPTTDPAPADPAQERPGRAGSAPSVPFPHRVAGFDRLSSLEAVETCHSMSVLAAGPSEEPWPQSSPRTFCTIDSVLTP